MPAFLEVKLWVNSLMAGMGWCIIFVGSFILGCFEGLSSDLKGLELDVATSEKVGFSICPFYSVSVYSSPS